MRRRDGARRERDHQHRRAVRADQARRRDLHPPAGQLANYGSFGSGGMLGVSSGSSIGGSPSGDGVTAGSVTVGSVAVGSVAVGRVTAGTVTLAGGSTAA